MNQKLYEQEIDSLEINFTEAVKECYSFLKEHSTASEELIVEKLQYAVAKIIEESKN